MSDTEQQPDAVPSNTDEALTEIEQEALEQLQEVLPPIVFSGNVPPEIVGLAPRQQAVMILKSLGYSSKQISEMLRMSPNTVRSVYRFADPDRKFVLTAEQVREVQRWKWQRLALLAQDKLLEPAALEDAKPSVLLQIAKTAQAVMDKDIESKPIKRSAAALLNRLREYSVMELEEHKENEGE